MKAPGVPCAARRVKLARLGGRGTFAASMRLLALDTSTFVGTVAVVNDGELLSECSASVRATHGETLLPHVARVIELAGLTLADIDVFAVGIGPGSFTGVRIGVATAKGLALAQNKPIVGVTSLRTLARGLASGSGLRVPVLDAHKGEVYCAAYALDPAGELSERVAPFHAAPELAARRLLAEANGAELWIAGNGLLRYGAAFSAPLAPHARRAPTFCDGPRAACLAHEAMRHLASVGPDDLAGLSPMYLRPSDAKLPTPQGD
jgi:tRNA threonylcarbamoyladenosine biosynthesis protein TsaB